MARVNKNITSPKNKAKNAPIRTSTALSAKIIKEQFNGLPKNKFATIIKNNNFVRPRGISNDEYLNRVRNIVISDPSYVDFQTQTAVKNIAKNQKHAIVQNRKENRKQAKIDIRNSDRNGYRSGPIYFPIDRFGDVSRWRTAYAKPGQGSLQQMYNNIQAFKNLHANDGQMINNYTLYIRGKNGNVGRYMSVAGPQIDVDSFNDFKESIDSLLVDDQENKSGSDVINENNEELDFSRFDIATKSLTKLKGSDSIKLYRTIGIDGGSSDLCVYRCLQHILGDEFKMTEDEFNNYIDPDILYRLSIKDKKYESIKISIEQDLKNNIGLSSLHSLAKWIIDNNHHINLILSTPKITERLFIRSSDNKIVGKLNGKRFVFFRASIENVQSNDHIYAYNCFFPHSDRFIIVDIHNEHADVAEDPNNLLNEFYFSDNGRYFVKNGDNFEELKYLEKHNVKEHQELELISTDVFKHKYIFYDYETVTDFSKKNAIIPVSLGFFSIDQDKLYDTFNDLNNPNMISSFVNKMKKRIDISHGKYCTKNLIDEINKNDKSIITLVSFNGARFDHYILYNELSRDFPDSISNVFFVKNELLNFNINRRHDLFDLCKHVKSSLSDACKGFGLDSLVSKKSIDFYDIQKLYDNNTYDKFIGLIASNFEFNDYLEHDVLALTSVFYKYTTTIGKILTSQNVSSNYCLNIHKFKTNGSLMTDVLDKHLKSKLIKLPTFNKDQIKLFNDLKSSQVGGKVDLINGVQKLDGPIFSVDCSGMYPFVMSCLDVYYPGGEIIEVASFDDMPDDLIGFFYCDNINQSNLITKILPEKLKNKTNDWHTNNTINNVLLSTVKISMLQNANCNVTIKNGFYFTKKYRSCDMFSFILDFMKTKSEQDILKEDSSPQYNEPLRQVVKELMLILSGKLAEGLYLTKTDVVDEHKYNEKYQFKEGVHVQSILPNGKATIKYNISEQDAIRHSKPVYISTLVYDYAQQYMYQNLWSKCLPKYSPYVDTDCLKQTQRGFDIWSKWALTQIVPHWPLVEKYDPRFKTAKLFSETSRTKVLGSFADEYQKLNFDVSYWLGKKRYFVANINDPKNGKMSFNGIKKNDIFLKEYLPNSGSKIDNLSDKELNDLYHTNIDSTIENNYLNFFESLYTNKSVYVLTNSIVKSKNTIELTSQCQIKIINL